MSEPLLKWRAEFPILDTCTYLVSHSLGAMPRRARVARGLVGAWPNDRRPACANSWRARRYHLDASERDRCAGDHRLMPPIRWAAPADRHDRPRVSVEHVPVRRLSSLRRGDDLRTIR